MTLKHQCIMQNNDTGVSAKDILLFHNDRIISSYCFKHFRSYCRFCIEFMFSTVPRHVGTSKTEHDFAVGTTRRVFWFIKSHINRHARCQLQFGANSQSIFIHALPLVCISLLILDTATALIAEFTASTLEYRVVLRSVVSITNGPLSPI